MNITSKIILRLDYTKKDGSKSVILRLTINRKTKYFTLNISCFEKDWLLDKCRVKKSSTNSYRTNLLLDKKEAHAKQIIFDYEIQDKKLSFLEFKTQFNNDSYNNKSFKSFVESQIIKFKDLHVPGTLKNYGDQLKKVLAFNPDITFSDLNLEFMSKYKQYLISSRGNNNNTAAKSLIFIKNMLNKAVESGVIKDNPCKNYKLERIEGNREHLSLDELDILMKLLSSGKLQTNKANVLRYFLFCCYTGLRYSDIRTLKYSDINEGIISIVMHKTGEFVSIPLISQALELMQDQNCYFEKQTIFKVLTDQPTNRYLKEIMKISKIKKSISFHCARHTFGMLSLNKGIPMHVVSKLMGHTDQKITEIYAQYDNRIKIQEMQKWEN